MFSQRRRLQQHQQYHPHDEKITSTIKTRTVTNTTKQGADTHNGKHHDCIRYYCFWYNRISALIFIASFVNFCYKLIFPFVLAFFAIVNNYKHSSNNSNNELQHNNDDNDFYIRQLAYHSSLQKLVQNHISFLYYKNHDHTTQGTGDRGINNRPNNHHVNDSVDDNVVVVRVLYCITSLNEYDNGKRETIVGYDRFSRLIVPVLRESIQSMMINTTTTTNSIRTSHHQQQRLQKDDRQKQNQQSTTLKVRYTVDVCFISHYIISKERYNELHSAFIKTKLVRKLVIWDNATPLGYSSEDIGTVNESKYVTSVTRSLSRQHRYVIKDNLLYYDLFINFEDDMIVKKYHIEHYIHVSNLLYDLRTRNNAPTVLLSPQQKTAKSQQSKRVETTTTTTLPPRLMNTTEAMDMFYGPMTEKALSRIIPGFVRVEVVTSETSMSLKKNWKRYDTIPLNYNCSSTTVRSTATSVVNGTTESPCMIDARICCHVDTQTAYDSNGTIPQRPTSNELYFWETSIEALGVRKMPSLLHPNSFDNHSSSSISSLDWVLLLGGNSEYTWDDSKYIIGDFWSGDSIRNPMNYFPKKKTNKQYKQQQQQNQNLRPDKTKGQYNNNQGGWMGTPEQIFEFHTRWCRGGYLPPYDIPYYKQDGLDTRTVEYWSGGIQIVGPNACNIQRIVLLDHTSFAHHLLYHASNNKQRSKNVQYHFSGNTIQEFWGQLNTIKNNAEQYMMRMEEDTA